jgi:hypothetical protein
MTDKEKLQKLFDAALKAPEPSREGSPQRAFPQSATPPAPVAAVMPQPAPVAVEAVLPDSTAVKSVVESSPGAPVLDDAASTELGILLDEQIARQRSKRRRDSLVAALVLFGMTGGGFGWFVQSPDRVEAVRSAMREIRSVGDVKAIVAKYQAALDRIAARSQQIDQATAAMGVIAGPEDELDPNFDAEMREMMGGEGKTTGQRNAALQKAFGNRAKEAGGLLTAKQGLAAEDSFVME